MTDFLDNYPLKLHCAHCGHKISKTVKWFKKTDNRCPKCKIIFDSTDIRMKIESIEEKIRDLRQLTIR